MRRLFRWVQSHRWRTAFGVLGLIAITCIAIAWRDTMADPVVRRTEVIMPGLPAGTPPITVVLMSDLHVANPDMPPSRLARIVGQVNDLRPDYVLIAGDLITNRQLATKLYTYREALAPLSGLKAKQGTFVVLGNHDHWRDPAEALRELEKLGLTTLVNDYAERGPLIIAGLDDDMTQNADIGALIAKLPQQHGRTVVFSHGPDVFPKLPTDMPLTLAGHTHCGQVRYPWGGSPAYMSNYGDRYACGRIDENGRTLIVTAGLGVSVLPFRFLVKPDVWLVTLRAPSQPTVQTQNGAQTSARTPPR